jgi:hypothetical protein
MEFDEFVFLDEIERLIEGFKGSPQLFQFDDEFLMEFVRRFFRWFFRRFARRIFYHGSETVTFCLIGFGYVLFYPPPHEILDDPGELFRVVADVIAFAYEVAFDDPATPLDQGFDVADGYRMLVFFPGVFSDEVSSNVSGMDQYVVYPAFSYVALDDRDEVFHRISVGFAMLGHDVADIDDFGGGLF